VNSLRIFVHTHDNLEKQLYTFASHDATVDNSTKIGLCRSTSYVTLGRFPMSSLTGDMPAWMSASTLHCGCGEKRRAGFGPLFKLARP